MLTPENPVAHYDIGTTRLIFTRCARTGIVEFSCLPAALADRAVPQRTFDSGVHITHLPSRWQPRYAQEPEWLIPFKTSLSPFANDYTINRSMRSNYDVARARLESHHATRSATGELLIETSLRSEEGLRLVHRVRASEGESFFRVSVHVTNAASVPVTLEYLPSFSLGGITPFDFGEAVERLKLHRFRSVWSAEGRHEARLLEELNLERSWIGTGRRTERFGQCGSLPVREWFPWAALEDIEAGVFWGAQLSTPGSWHLEVSRLKDKVILSGGLPTRDFGDWWITLQPGESFTTPEAVLACVAGDLDDLCHALTFAQKEAAAVQPTASGPFPVIFNEWCSTWGEPTHDYVVASAEAIARHQIADALVIDDGWAHKPSGGDIQNNGDWVVDTERFPNGLRATTEAIRALGIVPGIWFEHECVTEGAEAFEKTPLHLHRDGLPVQVGTRRFWDLRNAGAEAYLAERVIRRLRDDGFSYLKIDYNDCLPAGVDGPCSAGENLRQHLLGVQRFTERIRREVPGIFIESCSSGGHRLEPSFQAISAISQFSDAHETVAIPIIAANLHRLVLPQQLQVWCVIHADDTLQRVRYGLAAGFLGVLAISGDIKGLPESHLTEIAAARTFHRRAAGVIRDGYSRLHRNLSSSWNAPRGWQVLVRSTDTEVLVVSHGFASPPVEPVRVPRPEGNWVIAASFGDIGTTASGGHSGELALRQQEAFSGGALLLTRA